MVVSIFRRKPREAGVTSPDEDKDQAALEKGAPVDEAEIRKSPQFIIDSMSTDLQDKYLEESRTSFDAEPEGPRKQRMLEIIRAKAHSLAEKLFQDFGADAQAIIENPQVYEEISRFFSLVDKSGDDKTFNKLESTVRTIWLAAEQLVSKRNAETARQQAEKDRAEADKLSGSVAKAGKAVEKLPEEIGNELAAAKRQAAVSGGIADARKEVADAIGDLKPPELPYDVLPEVDNSGLEEMSEKELQAEKNNLLVDQLTKAQEKLAEFESQNKRPILFGKKAYDQKLSNLQQEVSKAQMAVEDFNAKIKSAKEKEQTLDFRRKHTPGSIRSGGLGEIGKKEYRIKPPEDIWDQPHAVMEGPYRADLAGAELNEDSFVAPDKTVPATTTTAKPTRTGILKKAGMIGAAVAAATLADRGPSVREYDRTPAADSVSLDQVKSAVQAGAKELATETQTVFDDLVNRFKSIIEAPGFDLKNLTPVERVTVKRFSKALKEGKIKSPKKNEDQQMAFDSQFGGAKGLYGGEENDPVYEDALRRGRKILDDRAETLRKAMEVELSLAERPETPVRINIAKRPIDTTSRQWGPKPSTEAAKKPGSLGIKLPPLPKDVFKLKIVKTGGETVDVKVNTRGLTPRLANEKATDLKNKAEQAKVAGNLEEARHLSAMAKAYEKWAKDQLEKSRTVATDVPTGLEG